MPCKVACIEHRQSEQAARAGSAHIAQAERTRRACMQRAYRTGRVHRQNTQAMNKKQRTQAVHTGSALSHRSRGQDTVAGLGMTNQNGPRS